MVEPGMTMADEDRDFQRIFTEYYPKITGYLRRLVGEVEAEDVAQEVFVKVNKGIDDFRGESRLSTWIYRIVTNAAMDHLRKPSFRHEASRSKNDDALADEIDMLPQESDPAADMLLIRKDMNECIRGLVNDLPENYRTALVLGDLEGFTNAEIAEILGVSLDAAKIRLHRARAKLKAEMEKECVFYRDDRNALSCDRKPPHDA